MYDQFGFIRSASGEQSIKLFIPDNTDRPHPVHARRREPHRGSQHRRRFPTPGESRFNRLGPGERPGHDAAPLTPMVSYSFTLSTRPCRTAGISTNIWFVSTTRPCVWSAIPAPNMAAIPTIDRRFVVGGSPAQPDPIGARLPSGDLIVYELMIDDFTKEYRGTRAPIDAIQDKLDLVQALGVNAIEFMPWIAWPDDASFSWGYNPAYFFSVESAYVTDPANPLDRLSRLAALITECHRRKIHVLLDIVLQHALQGAGTNGFPYYWLWQTPTDSPFIGQFEPAGDFGMLPLDYGNACTQQFVTDVCKYWLTRFKLDGFRFDQVTGFDNPQFPNQRRPETGGGSQGATPPARAGKTFHSFLKTTGAFR